MATYTVTVRHLTEREDYRIVSGEIEADDPDAAMQQFVRRHYNGCALATERVVQGSHYGRLSARAHKGQATNLYGGPLRVDIAPVITDSAHIRKEKPEMITALTLIRPYRAPQWLVEPVDECDTDDIAELERAGYEIVDRGVAGWGSHNAIVTCLGSDYLATIEEAAR